jgi:hypothetical protein
MKAKAPLRQSESRMSGNEQVRAEIEIFLQALDSYPARFAANPQITFEEHRASLMLPSRTTPASGQRSVAAGQ